MENSESIRQYLTFHLGEEQYGLDVLQVREVLEVPAITRVPRMPAYMKGVINIRGSVVPVIDLRLKLDMDEQTPSVHSRVVIIEIALGDQRSAIGILVDSVQEVVEIYPKDIAATPQIGTAVDASVILGIAKLEQGFIMLVNIEKIFSGNELSSLGLEENTGPVSQDASAVEASL